MNILVTGGAGFIGRHFVCDWLARHPQDQLVTLDAFTYAAHPLNLAEVADHPRHRLVKGDITDARLVEALLAEHAVDAIVNFAAHSHVDRSLHQAEDFIHSNIVGVYTLLDAALRRFRSLDNAAQTRFRFLQVGTDEVFGSRSPDEAGVAENAAYAPSSPYSASKAAADHLVHAWHKSYGLPTLTTHCSNNFGPFQHPEKFIPTLITRALAEQSLPIYGSGLQVRDWLYVKDHCRAVETVLLNGAVGESYNIAAQKPLNNLQLAHAVCALLDRLQPRADGQSYALQIEHVTDRPGHDQRYAINTEKLETQLGWHPEHAFDAALEATVQWYLDHQAWLSAIQNRSVLA